MVSALFFAFFATLLIALSIYARDAHAAVNSTINFQARVLTSGGAVIPDGNVSVQFKIYDAASAGTNEWTETQTLAAKNGYITASLGSVTTFPGTIDWSQEHWLTMNVNGDGEMGPTRMKITAVPYSFRSGQSDALTNGTGTITAAGLLQLSPSTIQATNSSTPALQLNQQGSGSLLKLQSGLVDKFTVSNAGDVAAAAGLTVGNSTSTTAGTIRWTGTAFEGYNGTSWSSLGGGLVVSSGATASFVSGLANVAGTATGMAVETLVFTSATAVSNTAGVTGFTAPAAGSFRTCLVKNNAAITAGTLNLRWRVNGVSVGAAGCTMNATANRQDAGSIDAGVVTFNAGDTIGIAFDTVGLLPAATNDFTAYWSVEYDSSSSSLTMQKVYDSSAAPVSVVTADNKDIKFTLSNTATDSNFLVDIASGSTSKFAIQNNGTDIFNVNTTGGVSVAGNLTVVGTETLSGNLIAAGVATGVTVTTAAPARSNVTTVTLTAAGSFANNDVIFINNAGQDYYTRIVSGGGTTTLTVSPAVSYDAAASVTKYTIQNIGATATDYTTQANRFFQGYFLGGVVVGAGSTTISDGNIESTTTLTLQKNGGALNVGGALTVTGTISGDASGLTNISGANLTAGSVSDTALSSNVTLVGNTFNGAGQLVLLDGAGALPALNGSALTNLSAANLTGALPALDGSALTTLNASNISSGTINDLRLSTNVTLQGNTFNGSNQLVKLDGTGALPALNGSALTTLNASNISSGTLNDARLSTNITAKGNAFNGISQLVLLDASGKLPSLDGSALTSLSSANLTGALPALNGSALVSLDASNISAGILSDTRLSANVTLKGNTFNGASQLVLLDGTGKLPALDGSALTSLSSANLTGALPSLDGSALTTLNASNISSGTLNDARLSTNITAKGNNFNGANQLVLLDGVGALPTLNGGALISLSGSNISSGTVADARLTNNVALLNTTQSFTAQKTFEANLVLGTDTASPTAGLLTLNDATGSNGFTTVLGTNTLTANRTLNLPDVSGTLLVLGPSAAQIDAGTNSSIFINKTGATGNILTLQKGTASFSVLNSGALQLQVTDASALTVTNAGGTQQYFDIDTSTAAGLVQIGGSTADANATLLVLDTKNTTGDPTGVNGGSYYNSSSNKFRCYQNNGWKDCITEATVRSFLSSTSVAIVDNNTTNYWRTAAENNNSYPNIILSQASGKSVRGTVTIETTATSNNDVEVTARVERGIGSVPTCGTGTAVGAQPGTFSSNTGGLKASTVQFIDTPNTTNSVYYVVCADTATVGTAANMTRIRVTLEEVNNSN